MHFSWRFALFKFLKMFHIIVIFPQKNKPLQVLETIVQNYQNVFGDHDLYRKFTIVCIWIICFFEKKFAKKYVPYTKRIALLKKTICLNNEENGLLSYLFQKNSYMLLKGWIFGFHRSKIISKFCLIN